MINKKYILKKEYPGSYKKGYITTGCEKFDFNNGCWEEIDRPIIGKTAYNEDVRKGDDIYVVSFHNSGKNRFNIYIDYCNKIVSHFFETKCFHTREDAIKWLNENYKFV